MSTVTNHEPEAGRRSIRLPRSTIASAASIAAAAGLCIVFTTLSYTELEDAERERGIVATLVLAAVAAILARWVPISFPALTAPSLSALADTLARRRRLLLALYLTGVCAWFGGAIALSMPPPNLLTMAAGHPIDRENSQVITYVTAAVFVLLQAGFLFGAGRVQLGARKPTHRLLLTLAIFGVLMSALTFAAGATLVQAVVRLDNDFIDRQGQVPFNVFLLILGSSWTLWMLIGWLAARDVDHPTALGRLTVGLLAGSWVEFYAAVLVEMAWRDRAESCPCASGSWIGLMIAGPVLIWALGPGLFLVYLRARRLREADSRAGIRVLRRKTTRGGESR